VRVRITSTVITSTVIAVAFLASACGVSRESATSAADTGTGATAVGPGSTTAPTAPPTTEADDQVAVDLVFGDGTATKILHGDLNKVAGPTRANDQFVKLAFQGTVPASFEATVLSQIVWSDVFANELAKAKAATGDADRSKAKDLLLEQLDTLFPDSTTRGPTPRPCTARCPTCRSSWSSRPGRSPWPTC
jgi:hypothetical protein